MIDIVIILALMLVHGFLAMMEIAFVSSKKVRIQERFSKGNKKAGVALKLLSGPEDYLSTVQVGITVLETIAGVMGGAKLADDLVPVFKLIPYVQDFATSASILFVISLIAYISIVIGDLVPKVIGLNNPEKLLIRFAPVMYFIFRLFRPVVAIFSISTRLFVKMLFIKGSAEPPVTEEELRMMIDVGSAHGVLQARQSEILHSILRFNDITVQSLMKNKDEVVWLDVETSLDAMYEIILGTERTRYPVIQNSTDNVIGVITAREFLSKVHSHTEFKLEDILYDPLIIPETMDALRLLDRFRETRSYIAIVMNAEGETTGVITLHDLIVHIVGELPEYYETEEDRIYRREDGSYLVDAGLLIADMLAELPIPFSEDAYKTVGGYITHRVKRIPRVGDILTEGDYILEVVDMDGIKIDKVLIRKKNPG